MSKIPSVFDIKSDYFALQEMMNNDELLFNEDTGEVIEDNTDILKEMMLELNVAKEEKLENIEYVKRELKITQLALKDEAKRLNERAKSLELNQKRLLDLQEFLLGGEKLKTDKFTFFYAKSESLTIKDDSAVPPDYINFEPKIDKAGLKKDVKNGLEVDGISIDTKIGLRVR